MKHTKYCKPCYCDQPFARGEELKCQLYASAGCGSDVPTLYTVKFLQGLRDWLAKEIKRMRAGIKDKEDVYYAHECRENLEFAKKCARALRGRGSRDEK